MRLRQLSRKLGVHPDKILAVLADSGQELENEANSKLTTEQLAVINSVYPMPEGSSEQSIEAVGDEILGKTSADVTTAPVNEDVKIDPELTSELAVEAPDLTHLEVPFGPPSHTTSQISDVDTDSIEIEEEPQVKRVIELEKPQPAAKVYNAIEEDEEFINAELIKTEKPVLEGLKVLGKIELPEPKKPVEKSEEEIERERSEKESKSGDRRRNNRNGRGKNQGGRNRKPRLSQPEYERQKAAKLAKKKKLEAQKKLKQKKEQHYRETLEAKTKSKRKSQQPTKPRKIIKQEEETIAPLPINGVSRPKPEIKQPKKPGALKRFWGWLNGASDKF